MTQRSAFLVVVCFAALSVGSAQLPKDPSAGSCETKNWNWKLDDLQKGPEAWARTYPRCAEGQQAPINLTSKGSPLKPFQVFYQPFTGEVLNNGYKVMVNVPTRGAGGYIVIDGRTFNLVEFHFHVHSEHTVNGHQFEVEAHLVHEYVNDANVKAAIAILYRLDEEHPNPLVGRVIAEAPLTCDLHPSHPLAQIDPRQLFPGGTASGTYYAYSGSLTNPDCIRIAHFLVAENTESAVDAATVSKLKEIVKGFPNNALVSYGYNFRPPQPLLPEHAVNHRTAVEPSGGTPGKGKR